MAPSRRALLAACPVQVLPAQCPPASTMTFFFRRLTTPLASAKGKGIGFNTRIEETDFELAGLHLTGLPDELIKPGRRHNTVAACVRIGAALGRRLSPENELAFRKHPDRGPDAGHGR